jgi:hypothetical protein
MTDRCFWGIITISIILSTSPTASAQALSPAPGATGKASAARAWVQPRTPDGQPDLGGVWSNATLTPFERPAALGSKQFFTEQEAADYLRQRIDGTDAPRRSGPAPVEINGRAYSRVWQDRGTTLVATLRTSQVIDPADGKVPPMTPEAQAKFEAAHAYAKLHPADGPEDRSLWERCILFGGEGPPMLNEPINNDYQIVQTPGYVTILVEMNHRARIIPLDGQPHAPQNMRFWSGDPRGHWEGKTLVVESTNFRSNGENRFGITYDGMTDDNLRIIERFTRTGPETIMYQATIVDPTVYTRPWTVELSMQKRATVLYEFACHEGNYGLPGILSGARAEERAAAKKSK